MAFVANNPAQRAGPFALANRLGVDEVVDPREIRNATLDALLLAEGREGFGGSCPSHVDAASEAELAGESYASS